MILTFMHPASGQESTDDGREFDMQQNKTAGAEAPA
jgi:hypothetical protein